MKKKVEKIDDEFVEVEIDFNELRRKVGPYWMTRLWYWWRYTPRVQPQMTFDEFLARYLTAAIEQSVWEKSPKMIVAGTDGSIRIEAVE